MDDMGARIDELENSIVTLMDQAGLDRDGMSSSSNSIGGKNSSSFLSSLSPPRPSSVENDTTANFVSSVLTTNNTIEGNRTSPVAPRHSQSLEI
jgi:hypothetical protein